MKDPQTYTLLPDQESRRLRCSEHGCALTLKRIPIDHPRRGRRVLEIFACPIEGCGTRRANKWQRDSLRANIARARAKQLEQRVDAVIDKIIVVVDQAMDRDRPEPGVDSMVLNPSQGLVLKDDEP